jgi:hypothetical protein
MLVLLFNLSGWDCGEYVKFSSCSSEGQKKDNSIGCCQDLNECPPEKLQCLLHYLI